MKVCSVGDCGRRADCRGWCLTHYKLARQSGEIDKLPAIPIGTRFFSKVKPDGECWRWAGPTDGKGYGLFKLKNKTVRAHRWAYEYLIAAIPDGLTIDHLCRNVWCVNPYHFDPVPAAINSKRGAEANKRFTCPGRHEYTVENTYINPKGRKECRICRARHRAAYRERRKKAA
ncbi:HNH endonuclease [Gordonia bronchialis]|uniref:HNH endonuclease n=1 Tax=Gordonia bronchialis TaxID=2054 RepID=UPI001CC0DA88|nr:HNH endonuclease [Gordonia bronchialis]